MKNPKDYISQYVNSTTKEFSDIEDIINRQMQEGSTQNKDYFNSKVHNGDMIWVDEYIRNDGTKVCGYYRTRN